MDRQLFDDSPAYTIGDPSSHGFHELERPQNMRWIATGADCRLPVPAGRVARPALREAGLGPQSRILDVGAGMGWSSALLSLFTGAQVVAVDLHPYDAPLGVPFKTELRRRLSRHLSVLKRSRGFHGVSDFADVE